MNNRPLNSRKYTGNCWDERWKSCLKECKIAVYHILIPLFKRPITSTFLRIFHDFQVLKLLFWVWIFLWEKPSKRLHNRVFIVGIIRVVLYLTLSLFRSIQVRCSLSHFRHRDKRLSLSLIHIWRCRRRG